MKTIFNRDKKLDNQSKKKRKRLKAQQDKVKVAKMKQRMDKELERMEQKRWNEVKQELPNIKMEKQLNFGLADDDKDIDLMEVDSPLCDEMTSDSMATANENDYQGNEANGNHDNEVDGNHDNEILNSEI